MENKADNADKLIADDVSIIGEVTNTLEVRLSNDLVKILSEQLYKSPLKAIEELVVNSYDAEARECRVFAPLPSDQDCRFVVVYDNGSGMSYEGLVNLWQIGRSNKRTEEITKRFPRKQIGKFGIGKLATYTIANKVTYISRSDDLILSVTLDFRSFSETTSKDPVTLSVLKINSWDSLSSQESFQRICEATNIDIDSLFDKAPLSWTFCILEDLKDKAKNIANSKLRWVLGTAMPLQDDFKLFLNCEEIKRLEESYAPIEKFSITDLPKKRLQALKESTGEEWSVKDGQLISDSFPSGVTGSVLITRNSLVGKSTDLARSHGFFVRARGRLLNEDNPYFGITQSSYETFARFRADIGADDLDKVITAPREGIEFSQMGAAFEKLLSELFFEARKRYEDFNENQSKKEGSKNEIIRNFVNPRLVEQPIADALAIYNTNQLGADADNQWFYITYSQEVDIKGLINSLYNSPREKYEYFYSGTGSVSRLVQFNPENSAFYINSDHDFVKAHDDDPRSRILLEDFATAEVLLEVYLRVNQIPVNTIGEILERRDSLLRSLAKDHPFSLKTISMALRDASAEKYDLEIALVAAARALGFVAKHIAGSGEPDGIARFLDYPSGVQIITLEAKSSKDIPSLGAIDFSGLEEHVQRHDAQGCLLVAPTYPGMSNEDSAAAFRAKNGHISCWTIDQVALVVEAAEARHITAQKILDIVLNYFTPAQVTEQINKLFEDPSWNQQDLYKAIIDALKGLKNRLTDAPRTISLIATEISARKDFRNIGMAETRKAIEDLASASHGLLTLAKNETIYINGSYEEIERRLSGMTKDAGSPRRPSNFRNGYC